jgi:hypothetical protein
LGSFAGNGNGNGNGVPDKSVGRTTATANG